MAEEMMATLEDLIEVVSDLIEVVNKLESRLVRLEGGRTYSDDMILELMKDAFDDDDDVLCKDLEFNMSCLGMSKAGYKRAVRTLKYDSFFVMEKFGVNWAFHKMADEEKDDE